MNDCFLSRALACVEDATDVADCLRDGIDELALEASRLQAKGVKLPRRLMRRIEALQVSAEGEPTTDALDACDAFVAAMQLHGIRS